MISTSTLAPSGLGSATASDQRARPRLLVVGGNDHELRIPFIQAMQRLGFDVTAAGTGDPAPFVRHSIPYHGYEFDRFINPAADVKAARELGRIITSSRPDVIQTFDTKPGLIVPVAARRTIRAPVVRTINGLGWVFSSNSPLALALRPVFDVLHRLTAGYTAVTVFQNRGDEAHFRRLRLNGRCETELIPGSGVDPVAFAATLRKGPSPDELRAQLGLAAGPVVTTVTRLSRIKGIPALLDAARIVHGRRPDVRFLLVGPRESEGPLAITQAEIDRHRPYVLPLGHRSDIPALLALSDVFAFPTELSEGVPRVLLEAALAEVPIVTTAMPGCVDVVREGESGFVVPVRSPERLAEKILDVLSNPGPARAMAARAGQLVRRDFTLESTVARYATTYGRLLSRAEHATNPIMSLQSAASR